MSSPIFRFRTRLVTSVLFVLLSLLRFSSAADKDEWRSRTIYQVVTDRYAHANDSTPPACFVMLGHYCGGTWRGIKDNLDYIEGMGFDAIWISPVVGNLPQLTGDGAAYTSYWQQNLYALNSNFGTRQDLLDLVEEIHARGMLLMLDIVVNHMGYSGTPFFIDYSVFYPFNDQKYFHDYCGVDNPANHTNAEQCWLGDSIVPLADLRTEDQEVQNMFGEWITEMVQNYSIDGLRIDTAINVQPDFFPEFVKAAGVFATGETMTGDNMIACTWEDTVGSILNYPIYYTLIRAFQDEEGSINDLVETIESTRDNCNDPTVLGSFSENHDVPRFANFTQDMALAKNVITYNFMSDGIPIIYQGQEQHMNGDVSPYMNRSPLWEVGYNTSSPLYTHILTLNKFRHHVIETSHNYTLYNNFAIYQDYHSLGMRKGYDGVQVITVLTNNGETCKDYTLALPNHGFPAGTHLTEVLSCTDLTVNATGYINLPMGSGAPKILYPTNLMFGSRLCDFPDVAPEGVKQAPQTTISTAYPTTISSRPTLWTTATVSPLPGSFTDAGEPVSTVHATTSVGMNPGVPNPFVPVSIVPNVPNPIGSAAHPSIMPSHTHHPKALGGASSMAAAGSTVVISAALVSSLVGGGMAIADATSVVAALVTKIANPLPVVG